MDALSDVLRVMRLKGGVFLHADFSAPWCLSVTANPENCAPFMGDAVHIIPYHFILEGVMRVRVPDGSELAIEAGESVLFPHNDTHLMGSDLGLTPVPGDALVRTASDGGLATIDHGGGGARTRMVCGFLGAEAVRGSPMLDALPAMLRLDTRDSGSSAWIQSTFRYAAERIAAGDTGSEVLMSKLSELLFVEAIQRYAASLTTDEIGWLAALKDPYVSRALALLHARVAESWTVDALGREVGLSRSALADRFGAILGMPPMQYLATWRIHAAAHELLNSGKSILQVAQEVGYDSEASFTRAFKRVMEAPPATWRRERQEGAG
jgi:AraC-like DNA-binding protein